MEYQKSRPYFKLPVAILTMFGLLLLDGCSTINDLSKNIQKPSISIQNVRITDFNFHEMQLTYDVAVKNPNSVSIQMLAYDYTLDFNDNTLAKGKQQERLAIEASGESVIQIPMTLNFQDLYAATQSLQNTDEAAYRLASNLTFDLPVMGRTELPVSKKGTLPVLKMPEIHFEDWSIENVSFSSAAINVQLAFDNPNNFGINVNSLDYDLMINGDRWANGNALQGARIEKKSVTKLNIPISVDMSKVGMSTLQSLTGSQQLDYRVKGNFDLNLQHPMLGQTTFDFDRSGELSLSRN